MIKISSIATCTTAFILMVGCATTAPSDSESLSTPDERIFLRETNRQSQLTSEIVFIRDVGVLGAIFDIRVLIDGVPVVAMRPGESYLQRVAAGPITVTAEATGPWFAATLHPVSTDVYVKQGEHVRMRIGFSDTNVVTLTRVFKPKDAN